MEIPFKYICFETGRDLRCFAIPLAELLRGLGSNGAQMLSLVGMRGGGNLPLVGTSRSRFASHVLELDQLIAEQAQMLLSENFFDGWYDLYREYESTTLQKLFESGKPIILALVVLSSSTFNWSRLRGYSRTVWLRCAPEVYLERVREQGDWRPMQGYSTPEEAGSILQEREKLYAQADMIVDTDSNTIAESVGQLKEFLNPSFIPVIVVFAIDWFGEAYDNIKG